MTRPLALASLTACLCLGGCLGQPPRKVKTVRDPALLERELSLERKDYWELVWEREAAERALQLKPDLERTLNRDRTAKLLLHEVLVTIPEDPWAEYEHDRKRVLYRKWADARAPLPADGPGEAAAGGDESSDEGSGDDE